MWDDDGAADKEALPEEIGEGKLIAAVEGRSEVVDDIVALKELTRRPARRKTAVMETVLADPDRHGDLRSTAAAALGRDNRSRNREALVAALDSKDPQVIQRAAEALGRMGDEDALQRLARLRPRDDAVRRSVHLARILISYRLGLESNRVDPPAADQVLEVQKRTATPIDVTPVKPKAVEQIAADNDDELPALHLSPDAAVRLSCGKDDFVLALNRDLHQRKTLVGLAKRSAIAGVVFKRFDGPDRYFVHEYLLSHPGQDDRLLLFGISATGLMLHAGTADLEERRATLTVHSLDTPHAQPVHIEAVYDHEQRTWTVGEARASELLAKQIAAVVLTEDDAV